MAHLQLISDVTPWSEYEMIKLNGSNCQTLRGFYEAIAESMGFPEYFGFNIDSLDDMLSNLSWMEEGKIAVYTENSELFCLKNETKAKNPLY